MKDPECIGCPMDQARGFFYAWLSSTRPPTLSNPASSPWFGGPPGDYVEFKDFDQCEQPAFGAYGVTRIADDSLPHRKALIYSDLKGKEGHIARGELLDILRLMIPQVVRRRFVQHMVFTVRSCASRSLSLVSASLLCN
ncbi:hypothetical protein BDV19DRAFT_252729 [Aspergillus venezuelensis]